MDAVLLFRTATRLFETAVVQLCLLRFVVMALLVLVVLHASMHAGRRIGNACTHPCCIRRCTLTFLVLSQRCVAQVSVVRVAAMLTSLALQRQHHRQRG